MADKDDKGKKGTPLRDPETGKFLGKYDTEEDVVKGYSELEKKLGEQGKQYGDTKKQYEQMQAEIAKYQQWAKEAAPIVEWYSKFNQPITQWWQHYQQQGQGTGQPMNMGGQQGQQQMWNQAANVAAQQPGFELLSQQEKQALVQQTAQYLTQQTLGPWTQNLAKTLEQWGETRAKSINEQLEQRLKAFSNVHWKTLERLVPPEKLADARAWHDEALKFADPSKIDPLDVASQTLEARNRISRLEAELKAANEKHQKAEKDALGSLGDSGGLFSQSSDRKEMTKTSDDRFKNVMSNVKEAVGVEGIRETFPSI